MVIRITVDGRDARTVGLAAAHYDLDPDAMRQAIHRLCRSGQLRPLDERLDGRPLYDAEALDTAMAGRPGKGANLRRAD